MAQVHEHRHVVYITGISAPKDQQLCIEINVETAPLTRTLEVCRYETKWNEALDLIKRHGVSRLPLEFNVWYLSACWDLLPPRHEFARFATITALSFHHYPHLEHIDVTVLPFLRDFQWFPVKDHMRSIRKREYTLSSIRITGLTQCKYLERLCLQGMLHHPFILKLKAPFRNLQALGELNVEFKCANQRYPLELVASQSLHGFWYNSRSMLQYFKALRSIVKCVCAVLCYRQSPAMKANVLAKAIACGPIHDPSLIVDVAWVIRRKMDRNSTPIAHAL